MCCFWHSTPPLSSMSQAWPVLVAATLGAASAGRLQPLHVPLQSRSLTFPEPQAQ